MIALSLRVSAHWRSTQSKPVPKMNPKG